jgi:hypothetical protein
VPIRPEMMALYPGGSTKSQLWQDLRAWVGLRSGNRCEGSPKYPDCRAENGKPHPRTGSKVVLTVAHMTHDLAKNGPGDLRHLCQCCHLTHDAPMKAKGRKERAAIPIAETTAKLRREVGGVAPAGEQVSRVG